MTARRVVVTLIPVEGNKAHRYQATCIGCGWTYANSVKSDVMQHKRWHTHLCTEEKP